MMKRDRGLTHTRVQEMSKSRKQSQQTYIAVMELFQKATNLVNGNILDKNNRPAPYTLVKINSEVYKILFNGRALNFMMVKGKKENEIEINVTVTDILKAHAMKQSELEFQLDDLLTETLSKTKSYNDLQDEVRDLQYGREELLKGKEDLEVLYNDLSEYELTDTKSISNFINEMNYREAQSEVKLTSYKKLSFALSVLFIGMIAFINDFQSMIG